MTLERHPHHLHARHGGKRHRHVDLVRHEELARRHFERPLLEIVLVRRLNARPRAGGNVEPGKAARLARVVPVQRAEIGVGLGLEVGVFERGAARHHAGDRALHQPLGLPGILHLIAEGYLVALAHQHADVVFRRVPRHPAHGHPALVAAAARERQLKFARGYFGIFKEKLVEVAHAVKKQRIGIILLDFQILPVHGRQFRCIVAHSSSTKPV